MKEAQAVVKALAGRRADGPAESCTEVSTIAIKLTALVIDFPSSPAILVFSATIIASSSVVCSPEEKLSLAELDEMFEEAVETLDTAVEAAQGQLETLTGATASPEEIEQVVAATTTLAPPANPTTPAPVPTTPAPVATTPAPAATTPAPAATTPAPAATTPASVANATTPAPAATTPVPAATTLASAANETTPASAANATTPAAANATTAMANATTAAANVTAGGLYISSQPRTIAQH